MSFPSHFTFSSHIISPFHDNFSKYFPNISCVFPLSFPISISPFSFTSNKLYFSFNFLFFSFVFPFTSNKKICLFFQSSFIPRLQINQVSFPFSFPFSCPFFLFFPSLQTKSWSNHVSSFSHSISEVKYCFMPINPAASSPSACLLVEERSRVVHERRFMSDSSANFTAHVWPIMSRLSLPHYQLLTFQTKQKRHFRETVQKRGDPSHISKTMTEIHIYNLQSPLNIAPRCRHSREWNPLCYRLLPDPLWLNLIQLQSLCITGM